MKNCLMYQPYGLGDIFWCMQIADRYIKSGYTVYFPVGDLYYDQVVKYIKKDGLVWCKESDEFPLKYLYGTSTPMETQDGIYIPVSFANYMFPQAPLMVAKLILTNTPIKNWWDTFDIERNPQRENTLINHYELTGDYILVNKTFGTYGFSNPADVGSINMNKGIKVHKMDFEQDRENGFHLFDWIGALEDAKEIHSVHTSITFLIDKYCHNNKIFMYERRKPEEPRNFHSHAQFVFRNPNWIYMD